MNPKISVIVPIYKVEKYLETCLCSIVNQTYKNLEIILVDDGSPDKCPEICDTWRKKDNRIIVIHKENEGLGFARNSGLEKATGEYVVFVDSDDFIDESMIETLYDELIIAQADTAYCGLKRVYESGKIQETESLYHQEVFKDDDIIDKILLRMLGNKPEEDNGKLFYMAVWHAVYSMKIIKENNIRFPSERVFMSEDMSFHIDYLYHSKKIVCISTPFYNYRVNENSLSLRYDPKRFQRLKIMHGQILEKLSAFLEEKRYFQIELGWFLSMTRGQLMEIVKRKERNKIVKINNIINDEQVKYAITHFEFKKNPIKRRIFNYLIYKRCPLLLYIVISLYVLLDK